MGVRANDEVARHVVGACARISLNSPTTAAVAGPGPPATLRQNNDVPAVSSVRATHGLRRRALPASAAHVTHGSSPTARSAAVHTNEHRVHLIYKTTSNQSSSHCRESTTAKQFVSPKQPRVGSAAADTTALRKFSWTPPSAKKLPSLATATQSAVQQRALSAARNGQRQSPSKQQLKQAWEQLRQHHKQQQQHQQADLYQHRLRHQVHRLHQHQHREQHQQHQIQQRKARLYSLRSRTPSPLRSSTPQELQHPQAVGSIGAYHAHANLIRPPDQPALHAGQQQHVASAQQRPNAAGSDSGAFANKLQALKHSNQRLRASTQTAAGPAKAASSGSAAVAHAAAAQTAAVAPLAVSAAAVSGMSVGHQSHGKVSSRNADPMSMVAVPPAAASQGSTSSGQISAAAAASGHVIGGGHSSNARVQAQAGLVAGLVQDALQVDLIGGLHWQQQQAHQQQQQPGQDGSLLESAGSNGACSSVKHTHHRLSSAENASGSRTEDITDTASSISFSMDDRMLQQLRRDGSVRHDEHLHQQSAQDEQQQHQQQQQQIHPAKPEWHRHGRVRTALFASPHAGGYRRNRPFSPRSSSSSSSCSFSSSNDDSEGDPIAEAEQQLQQLLNHTGRQGPVSPSGVWRSSKQTASAATGAEPQQQQQQQEQALYTTSASYAEQRPAAVAAIASSEVFLLEGGSADADELLWEAEEGFLQMLEASAQQSRQQQQRQSSDVPLHDHPWRPPGIAPAPSTSPSSSSRVSKVDSGHKQLVLPASKEQHAFSSQHWQHQHQRLPSSFAAVEGCRQGPAEDTCNSSKPQWRLSIPESLDEEVSPSPTVLQTQGLSPSAAYTIAAAVGQPSGPAHASPLQQKARHQGQHSEQHLGQRSQQLIRHLVQPGASQTAIAGWQQQQQQGRAALNGAARSRVLEGSSQQLALRVLHEWSYQAASSRWQQLMQSLGEVETHMLPEQMVMQEPLHHLASQHQSVCTAVTAAAAAEDAATFEPFLQQWHQQAQQQTAAAAIFEQQWTAHRSWRVVAHAFSAWRCQALDGVLIAEVLEEQARGFAQQCCMRRVFDAWRCRYLPVSRAHALLKDANSAAADAFAAARAQRLLGHCLTGWTAAVIVGQSARSAAQQLLQRVWLQVLTADWRDTVGSSRELKSWAWISWKQAVLQQQVAREAVAAADLFAAHALLQKACRSWVVAWCRSASARVFAKQLQAKQQAAVLTALAHNAQYQQHKHQIQQRADTFRRSRLLHLCFNFWRAWAVYKGILAHASATVSAALQLGVLRSVFVSWCEVARCKTWKHRAVEGADGFYCCRLLASHFYYWHSYAQHCTQLRHLGDSAAARHGCSLVVRSWGCWRYQACLAARLRAVQQQRQRQLLKSVLDLWWAESAGTKRVFEFQVSALVRLVTRCFKSWQYHACQSKQLQQRLVAWQQQQNTRQHQQQQQPEILQAWHQYVQLIRGWRAQAPLLAAAYYQGHLIKLAWQAWQQQIPQRQQQQPGQALQQEQGELHSLEQELSAVLLVEQQPPPPEQPCAGQQEAVQQASFVNSVDVHQHAQSTGEAAGTAGGDSAAAVDCGNKQVIWQVQQGTAVDQVPYEIISSMGLGALSPASASAAALGGYESDVANVEAWRGWQQQQQEQQLELLQLTAAAHQHAVRLLRTALTEWARIAAAAAAMMAAQAQLKHSCQLELLQQYQQQQVVQQQCFNRLVGRPFRVWLQQAMLKRSAAIGFRCYNQLMKGFLGWKAVLLIQRQEQQQHDQQQLHDDKQWSQSQALSAYTAAAAACSVAAPAYPHAALIVEPPQTVVAASALYSLGSNGYLEKRADGVLQWVNDISHSAHADQKSGGIQPHIPTAMTHLRANQHPYSLPHHHQQQQYEHYQQQAAVLPAWMLQPSHDAAVPVLTAGAVAAVNSGVLCNNSSPTTQEAQQQHAALENLGDVTCVQDLHDVLLGMA